MKGGRHRDRDHVHLAEELPDQSVSASESVLRGETGGPGVRVHDAHQIPGPHGSAYTRSGMAHVAGADDAGPHPLLLALPFPLPWQIPRFDDAMNSHRRSIRATARRPCGSAPAPAPARDRTGRDLVRALDVEAGARRHPGPSEPDDVDPADPRRIALDSMKYGGHVLADPRDPLTMASVPMGTNWWIPVSPEITARSPTSTKPVRAGTPSWSRCRRSGSRRRRDPRP